MSKVFVCSNCGGTFPMGDGGEAQAELRENFGDVNPADCMMVCDDCYDGMVA